MYIIPTINMTATGHRIQQLRKSAGLSVCELQDMLGLGTVQAIYKWQRGDCMPTIDNLIVLAAIFHVKIDDILVVDEHQEEISA